jgi:ammonium transporter, Amt family
MSKIVFPLTRVSPKKRPKTLKHNSLLSTITRVFPKFLKSLSRLGYRGKFSILFSIFIVLGWGVSAIASESTLPENTPLTLEELKVGLDTLWVIITAMLVFFMNAGFCMLETGFCRQKNAVNVLAKNLIVFALSTVAFFACGFALMFSNGNDFIGTSGGFFLRNIVDNSPATGEAYQGIFQALSWTGVPLKAKFFFQLVFAGTAATIVSGAVAERIKFINFLIFSLLLIGIAYPITGHWIWGGGWLAKIGFRDFAGATVVHSVGGWAALMGAIFLGPRLGKYQEGETYALPGHNMSIATLGCLILWLGWFGFNPGSTMALQPNTIAHIALTTNISAAFGGIIATIVSWLYLGKPDLTVIINGILAALVGITGSCAWVNLPNAAIIGSVTGCLVVFAVTLFDHLKIDDPVGAISVHLVGGIWGTLAVGLFAEGDNTGLYKIGPLEGILVGGNFTQLGIQLLGIISVAGITVFLTSLFWSILKFTLGIRVSPQEELSGLDIGEHGMEAYSGFLKETRSGVFGDPNNPRDI